ncbi:MAG: FtsK/SpoIIIE domain-containing protein [Caldilineaceae bacterium]
MANLLQWVAWAERKLAAIVVAEGLRCGLAEVKQGPLVITFRVRLLAPNPSDLRKLLALGPALAQALHVEGVRICDTARGILIEIPSPQPRTPSGVDLACHAQGLTIPIGLDQWRQPVLVDLRHHPTLLFVGPPRRGKTSAMKSILAVLVNQNAVNRVRYVIISQRRTDWTAFEHLAGCLALVNEPQEGLEALTWGVQLMAQRSQSERTKVPVVFIVDDLTNLLRQEPKIATPLGEIATMGGGVNLFLMIGTHLAGSKTGTGDSNMEASATARLIYKPASASTGARSAGAGQLGLEQLSGYQGDCLLLLDGYPQRIATAHTDDRLIAQLPASDPVVAPWRRATSKNRPATSENRLPPAPPVVATPIAQPDPPSPTATEATEKPVAVVAEAMFPIEKRPLTAEEGKLVQALYNNGTGESINALCKRVYGSKYRKTFDWIVAALNLPPQSQQAHRQETEGTSDLLPAPGDEQSRLEPANEEMMKVWEQVQQLNPAQLLQ